MFYYVVNVAVSQIHAYCRKIRINWFSVIKTLHVVLCTIALKPPVRTLFRVYTVLWLNDFGVQGEEVRGREFYDRLNDCLHILHMNLGNHISSCDPTKTNDVLISRWVRVKIMVFNAIFNNISVISWRSDLLVEENQRACRKILIIFIKYCCIEYTSLERFLNS